MKAPTNVASTRVACTECALAGSLKYLLECCAGGGLDLGSGVDEGEPQPLRQPPADAGLARPHQADQRNRLRRPQRTRHAARRPVVETLMARRYTVQKKPSRHPSISPAFIA